MAPRLKIGDRDVGDGCPSFLVVEVAQNHEGSLSLAHSFIELASSCGADAVKFQTHLASEESTQEDQFRVPVQGNFRSRYDYWEAMEFNSKEWRELSQHASDNDLIFLSSPFSRLAVRLLEEVGAVGWKVGSGELLTDDLLESLSATGLPVILSTGMTSMSEVERAVDVVRSGGSPFAVLQCVSRYPAPLEEVGLNVMHQFASRFDCPVGLSDHSGTVWPSLAAMAQGASIIEVHITFDRRVRGPDASVSLEPEEVELLAQARDAFWKMAQNPVDKDSAASGLGDMRALFTKSIAPARDLQTGTLLNEEMLTLKKPGTGIPPNRVPDLVGRRLRRAVAADRLLSWEDVDD
jgi:N-acetylneuraminate synthase